MKGSQGTWVTREVVVSKPFAGLSARAMRVYLLFLFRRKMGKHGRRGKERWTCLNNGELVFPYREAERDHRMAKKTFSKALDDLIEVGLLEIASHGGSARGDVSRYSLSERWRKFDTTEFEVRERSRDPVQRGFCKPRKNVGSNFRASQTGTHTASQMGSVKASSGSKKSSQTGTHNLDSRESVSS